MKLSYYIQEAPITPDFNDDDIVDDGDIEIWQQGFGTQQDPMLGDADLDGDADGYDFLIWQVQFESPPCGLVAKSVAIPEPRAFVLLSIFTSFTFPFCRKRIFNCISTLYNQLLFRTSRNQFPLISSQQILSRADQLSDLKLSLLSHG